MAWTDCTVQCRVHSVSCTYNPALVCRQTAPSSAFPPAHGASNAVPRACPLPAESECIPRQVNSQQPCVIHSATRVRTGIRALNPQGSIPRPRPLHSLSCWLSHRHVRDIPQQRGRHLLTFPIAATHVQDTPSAPSHVKDISIPILSRATHPAMVQTSPRSSQLTLVIPLPFEPNEHIEATQYSSK